METLQSEFFDWLCETFGFVAGEDAFMNHLPSTIQTHDVATMWLVENDSLVVQQFASSSKLKEYSLLINYRASTARQSEIKALEMEQVINHLKCFDLPTYRVISIQANSFGGDIDPDAEEFTRSVISVSLRVLDNYES